MFKIDEDKAKANAIRYNKQRDVERIHLRKGQQLGDGRPNIARMRWRGGFDAVRRNGALHAKPVGNRLVGKEIGLEEGDGKTTLHKYVLENRPQMIKHWIRKGKAVDPQDVQGIRPLHIAAYYGYDECARQLIHHGADIEATVKLTERNPLHLACSMGHAMVVSLLLYCRAFVAAEDDEGSTPLHHAAVGNHPLVCEQLIQHGARCKYRNNRGETPVHAAVEWQSDRALEVMMRLGEVGSANSRDFKGATPLHKAAEMNKMVLVRILMEGGANASTASHKGVKASALTQVDGIRDYIEKAKPLGTSFAQLVTASLPLVIKRRSVLKQADIKAADEPKGKILKQIEIERVQRRLSVETDRSEIGRLHSRLQGLRESVGRLESVNEDFLSVPGEGDLSSRRSSVLSTSRRGSASVHGIDSGSVGRRSSVQPNQILLAAEGNEEKTTAKEKGKDDSDDEGADLIVFDDDLKESEMEEVHEWAALRIQQEWRLFLDSLKKMRARRKRRFDAAAALQSRYRGWKVREEVEALKEVYNRAATNIQRVWRGKVARNEAQELLVQRQLEEQVRRKEAAITIQRYCRGRTCRRELAMQKERQRLEEWSAKNIQRLYRGHAGRVKAKEERDRLELRSKRERAAIEIQSLYRGWCARREFQDRVAAQLPWGSHPVGTKEHWKEVNDYLTEKLPTLSMHPRRVVKLRQSNRFDPPPTQRVVRWALSIRFGLGYLMDNGMTGVVFRDGDRMVLGLHNHIEYLEKHRVHPTPEPLKGHHTSATTPEADPLSGYKRTFLSLSNVPPKLKKKASVLANFRVGWVADKLPLLERKNLFAKLDVTFMSEIPPWFNAPHGMESTMFESPQEGGEDVGYAHRAASVQSNKVEGGSVPRPPSEMSGRSSTEPLPPVHGKVVRDERRARWQVPSDRRRTESGGESEVSSGAEDKMSDGRHSSCSTSSPDVRRKYSKERPRREREEDFDGPSRPRTQMGLVSTPRQPDRKVPQSRSPALAHPHRRIHTSLGHSHRHRHRHSQSHSRSGHHDGAQAQRSQSSFGDRHSKHNRSMQVASRLSRATTKSHLRSHRHKHKHKDTYVPPPPPPKPPSPPPLKGLAARMQAQKEQEMRRQASMSPKEPRSPYGSHRRRWHTRPDSRLSIAANNGDCDILHTESSASDTENMSEYLRSPSPSSASDSHSDTITALVSPRSRKGAINLKRGRSRQDHHGILARGSSRSSSEGRMSPARASQGRSHSRSNTPIRDSPRPVSGSSNRQSPLPRKQASSRASGVSVTHSHLSPTRTSALSPTRPRPPSSTQRILIPSSLRQTNATTDSKFSFASAEVQAAVVADRSKPGTWTLIKPINPKSPTPQPRCGHTAVWTDAGTMLVYGGTDRDGNMLGDLWSYDIITKVWREVGEDLSYTERPPPRSGHCAVYVPKKKSMIVQGGRDRRQPFCDVWEWSMDAESWSLLSSPTARTDRAYLERLAMQSQGGEQEVYPIPCFDHSLTMSPDGSSLILFGGRGKNVTKGRDGRSVRKGDSPSTNSPSGGKHRLAGNSPVALNEVWSFSLQDYKWTKVWCRDDEVKRQQVIWMEKKQKLVRKWQQEQMMNTTSAHDPLSGRSTPRTTKVGTPNPSTPVMSPMRRGQEVDLDSSLAYSVTPQSTPQNPAQVSAFSPISPMISGRPHRDSDASAFSRVSSTVAGDSFEQEVWYDPVTGEPSPRPPSIVVPEPRAGHHAYFLRGRVSKDPTLVVSWGTDSSCLFNNHWTFNMKTKVWTKVKQPLPKDGEVKLSTAPPRMGQRACVVGERAVVVGGWVPPSVDKGVWSMKLTKTVTGGKGVPKEKGWAVDWNHTTPSAGGGSDVYVKPLEYCKSQHSACLTSRSTILCFGGAAPGVGKQGGQRGVLSNEVWEYTLDEVASSSLHEFATSPYVERWFANSEGIIFFLDSETLQLQFPDGLCLMMTLFSEILTVIDKDGKESTCSLGSVIRGQPEIVASRLHHVRNLVERLLMKSNLKEQLEHYWR